MRAYSAGEALGPAWEHTKQLMWQDHRLRGRLLKLSLVAFGAEMGTSFNFNLNSNGLNGKTDPALASFMIMLFVVVLVFALAVFVVTLYLGSRLQLAQFDILVLRNPMVTPGWQRHGRHTWRWAGLKVVILIGTLVVLLPLVIPAIPIFASFFRALMPVAGADRGLLPPLPWAALGIALVEIVALLTLAVMLIRFVTTLVLPGVALEDLRFGAALRRGWELFRSDVGGMLWFAVMQPLVLLLLGLLLGMVLLLLLGVVALFFAMIGWLLWHTMHAEQTMAWFVVGIVGVLGLLVAGTITFLAYLVSAGTLLMFARAWSLYFLGGRYPLLGQYLEPGPAVPVWTPPPSRPRDEDRGGPGFPADPALA